MNASRGFPIVLFLLLICTASVSPARAQYIYLDLNGDGLNTPLDVLSGIVPVNVGVYLRTDINRDGSPATCPTGQVLSIGSFEFILRSVGGTVSYGALSGGLFAGGIPAHTQHDDVDFYAGRFDSTAVYVPAGKILLGTIPVTPLTGTPLLTFATSTPLSARFLTSFGSQCRGADGEYTMVLGRDWGDADGTFGTVLANVSGKVFQDANGTSTGNCQLDAGESGVAGWVVTLNPLNRRALTTRDGSYQFLNVPPGLYSIQVSVPAPWVQTCPPAGAEQPVTVLVNQTYSALNFGVRPSSLPPLLNPLTSRTIPYGQVTNQPLTASDPDGAPLTFSLLNGPGFASVTTTGSTTGNLQLAPLHSDVGVHSVTVAASDGVYDSRRSATFRVLNATGVAVRQGTGTLAVTVSPNPLNPAGTLEFSTSLPGNVRVALYDVRGRLIRVILDKPLPAGRHEVPLDGLDDRGGPLASGVYFFEVETVDGSQRGRAAVVR